MDDLIRRSDVLGYISRLNGCGLGKVKTLEYIRKYVERLPSADRPQGEWIVYEGGWKDLDYYPPKCKCNQCGYEEDLYILNAKPTNFCPNCGADMREREGE